MKPLKRLMEDKLTNKEQMKEAAVFIIFLLSAAGMDSEHFEIPALLLIYASLLLLRYGGRNEKK